MAGSLLAQTDLRAILPEAVLFPEALRQHAHPGRAAAAGAPRRLRRRRKAGAFAEELSRSGDGEQPRHHHQKLTVEFSRDAITRAFSIFDPLGHRALQLRHAQPTVTRLQPACSSGATTAEPAHAATSRLQYSQTLQTGTQYNVIFSGHQDLQQQHFLHATIRSLNSESQLQHGSAAASGPRHVHYPACRSPLRGADCERRITASRTRLSS